MTLTVSPEDFNKHQKRLTNHFDDEISYRCSISRGYYYVFHYIRSNWNNHPKSDFRFKSGDHGRVRDFLREVGEKDLADTLEDMHDLRKIADYDIDNANKNILEAYYVGFSNDLVKLIQNIQSSPNL